MTRSILIVLILFLLKPDLYAAGTQAKDTVNRDSLNLSEAILIKDNQQRHIDSLVKIQLEKELKLAAGNTKKTQELEKKLRQIQKDDSIRRIEQAEKVNELKKTAVGHPVYLNQDTMFYVFTRFGALKPRERAEAINRRVEQMYHEPFFSPDSLSIGENEGNYEVVYKKDNIIMTVTTLDGLWFGKGNHELAKEYLQLIKQSIVNERRENSVVNMLKRVGLVVLVVFFLFFLVRGINRIFSKAAAFLTERRIRALQRLKMKQVKFFSPAHLENLLLKTLNIIKYTVIFLLIYLSLPVLFSIFPETKGWTDTLLSWILSPLRSAMVAVVHYMPSLFTVLVIYFLFRYTLKGIRYFFYEVDKGNIRLQGFYQEWAIPTFNILKFVLYAFMLVLVFPYLPGSSSPAFQGVSVFLGILLSFGSSSAITNVISGLVITYMRPFKVGDRVKIGDVTGDVVEKTLLVTRIRTIKNEDVTVPNSSILSNNTINYSSNTEEKKAGLIINYTISAGYTVPYQTVYDLLITSALKTNYIVPEPKPFVMQKRLDDFYVSYQINAYTYHANLQEKIYSNLLENIQDSFNAAGIDLLSPHYRTIR